MFTVKLRKGVYAKDALISAKTSSLDGALEFVRQFTFDGAFIASSWTERDGAYVMDVYDWCDCLSADPPVLACIIAPTAFSPPA